MYVEMVCSCTASFSIDSEENYDSIWHLTYRFANAHVNCGYLTPGASPEADEEIIVDKRIMRKKKIDSKEQELEE